MRIIFFSYFIFLMYYKSVYAGAFTESSAASSSSSGLSATTSTLIPIENLAITGSIYLGKQIYDSGGFATFGLIPELIGRMPIVTYLNPLDKEALRLILTKPKNAIIKQYKKLFDMEGVILTFNKKAIEIIVSKAMEFKLGARGLRTICEVIMLDAMFQFPSEKNKKELKITEAYVKKQLSKFSSKKLQAA